jgi:hypothetical protein
MAYPYQSLSTPNEIRLLILNPSCAGSKITCQLVHRDVDSRPYEAVSYEWGLPSKEDPEISIENHAIVIRRNLYFALQQFRHENEERVLWIDAICINQNDNEEKGRQVQFMRHIYTKAEVVLIWLGVEDPDTYLAYNCMHRIEALTSGENTGIKLEEVPENDGVIHHGFKGRIITVTLSKTELLAAFKLFEKSYWYRGWIVQEISLADRFSLQCGKQRGSSITLEHSCHNLYNALNVEPYSINDDINKTQGMQVLALRNRMSTRTTTVGANELLLFAMQICRRSKCTEFKDYVYAFVALDPYCGIVVDYDISSKRLIKQVRQIENERFARERREEGQIFYDRHEASKELRKKLLDKQSRYRRPLSKLENILESFLTWED